MKHTFPPEPHCKITRLSWKSTVTIRVSQPGQMENIQFFFWERGRKKNSRSQPGNSQDFSEVWLLLLEPVWISCWLWRHYTLQVLSCGQGEVMWPIGAFKTSPHHHIWMYIWRMCTDSCTSWVLSPFNRLYQLGWMKRPFTFGLRTNFTGNTSQSPLMIKCGMLCEPLSRGGVLLHSTLPRES